MAAVVDMIQVKTSKAGDMKRAILDEMKSNLAEWLGSEDDFVNRILARIPPTPPNYIAISQFNERGEWPDADPMDLEVGANRCAVS